MAGKTLCADCCGCVIAEDDFNRADSDNLGASWANDTPPVAAISGNEAVVDESAPQGIVRFLSAHPDGAAGEQAVTVRVKRSSDDPQARIALGINSTTGDYLLVAIDTSAGCVRLGLTDSAATIESLQTIPESDVGEWITVKACWFPGVYPTSVGILRARVEMPDGMVYGDQLEVIDSSPYGEFVGIGATGPTTPAWQVHFDDFVFAKARDPVDAKRCPDCNTPCLIAEDDFNRADSTDLGCKWEEISGVWQIVSQELTLVSGGPGIALCRVHHPQDKTHHYVTVDAYAASGKRPQVLLNATGDASSYHWAELSLSGSTLTLAIGKDGTTLDSAASTLAAEGFVEVIACYDGHKLTATANGSIVVADSDEVVDGTYAGLAGGSSGGERFETFEFWKHLSFTDPVDRACPNCVEPPVTCSDCCPTQQLPYELVVDIGTWTLTPDDTCSGVTPAFLCAGRGGEYVADNLGVGVVPSYCVWEFADSQHIPEQPNFIVRVTLFRDPADSLCQLEVRVSFSVHADFPCIANRAVAYRSAKFVECPTFPMTLALFSDVSAGGPTNSPCLGAPPASVTVDEP